jgi:hypothetical protein
VGEGAQRGKPPPSGLLFGVTPLDLPTFAGVSLLLFAVACLASVCV